MENDKLILGFKSFYAGIFIGIGAIVYMMNPGIIGAILFTIGLFGCINNRLTLFTGKVGYSELTARNLLTYFGVMLLFNALGIMAYTSLIGSTMTNSVMTLAQSAHNIVCNRLTTDWLGIFAGSIGCGMLMSHAVDRPTRTPDAYNNLLNYIPMLYCVPVFIMSGFPHCVADVGYYTIYSMYFGFKPIILIIWTLSIGGNILGCQLMGIVAKQLREFK